MTAKPGNIFLTGFSTSGKTTIGKRLSEKLNMRFYDTDTLIEKREALPIAAIFRRKGERYFRSVESEIIREIINRKGRKVVALGGGAFKNKSNRDIITASGTVIFLSCSVAELYRRLREKKDRPLLDFDSKKCPDRESKKALIKTLLNKRMTNYLKADYRVSTTSKSIALTLNEIVGKVKDARYQG